MFRDREDAGEQLAFKLEETIKDKDCVVVSLLRGGIVLGRIVADHFQIPLFPLSVKKIGAPFNRELGIGAVTLDGTSYLDKNFIQKLDINKQYLDFAVKEKSKEALEYQKKFISKIAFENKKVIIVDDGIATGATAIVASLFCKKNKAKKIILGTPLIPKESFSNIKTYFDKVISLEIVENLGSVSQFYINFPQVEDKEVEDILNTMDKTFSK